MTKQLLTFPGRLINTWLITACLLICCCSNSLAITNAADTTPTSTHQQAIEFIEQVKELEQSPYWPQVKPDLFLQNVKENIYNPLGLYEGSNTNFCSFAALSYLPLNDDPLGYAKFMLKYYQEGKATYGKVFLNPPTAIRQAAGTLQFRGELDRRPAEQIWFLSLADRFKGYINLLNPHYKPGDENTFWASTNYAKFNRMVRKLFNYKISARGSDLFHPWIKDLYGYISEKLKTGTTVLYLNNTYLRKKNHNKLKLGIPTHFVVLLGISKSPDGMINIIYWDYGLKTLRQITNSGLKKIIFGISHFTKKLPEAKND